MRPSPPDAGRLRLLDTHIRQARRKRSLQTCHRPAIQTPWPEFRPRSNAYAPQFSARLLNDPNLSDGARRCALKLLELVYRHNRKGRVYEGTVVYLAKALNRSERAVQYYLAQLRAGGYILHEVVKSQRARMCVGVVLTLLKPLFPAHHIEQWPVDSGVQRVSGDYSLKIKQAGFKGREAVDIWAMRCMDGVFRAFMKSDQGLSGSAV
jgi:hypothetical protein